MNFQEICERLEGHLMNAGSQFEDSVSWYAEAHNFARQLAKRHKVTIAQAAGIIAALSPNNKWQRNKIDAEAFLTAPSLETKVCTFMGQRRKALLIMDERDPEKIAAILGGRKTISFYRNILDPLTSEDVTVDLWMYRAAGVPQSDTYYQTVSRAIAEVASRHGLRPHEAQALIWTSIRGAA